MMNYKNYRKIVGEKEIFNKSKLSLTPKRKVTSYVGMRGRKRVSLFSMPYDTKLSAWLLRSSVEIQNTLTP